MMATWNLVKIKVYVKFITGELEIVYISQNLME